MSLPPSDHFNGKTFFQPHHASEGGFKEFLRWQLTARRARWPKQIPIPSQPPPPAPARGEVVITWLGHATFLLQTVYGNILTDPVFSERTSPVSWLGPRRVHPPGVAFEDLPPIRVVLLSHDHYDHCDTDSLQRLARGHDPTFVAPLRHRDLLERSGARQIVELDWWQSHPFGTGEIMLTPTKHWSNRFGTPRNHRLWGGFFLTIPDTQRADTPPAGATASHRIWFVGDSGYDEGLVHEVRQRLGAPDVALVPIGAYEPRWFMAPMHMNPTEAVQVHQIAGAKRSIGMHWGTFRLTDEAREAPVHALAEARDAAGLPPDVFRVLAPGESVTIPPASL
jgi:L-ascorbate metabolism protein UlaG (beta-lactamase superfamily)